MTAFQQGDDPFADFAPTEEQESKTPADSSTEKESTEEESPSQEGEEDSESTEDSDNDEQANVEEEDEDEDDNTPSAKKEVPFHKNPRFKRLYQENKELKSTLEDLTAKIDGLINSKSEPTQEVPEEFKYLFGDNPEAYEKFQKLTEAQASKLVEERLGKKEVEQSKASKAQAEAERVLEETMEEIADEAGGLTESQRNEIYKVAMEYRPVDEHGNIDLKKSHILWQKLTPQKEKSTAKKEIAAKTTSNSAPGTTKSKVLTTKDLRNMTFGDLAQ